MAEQGPKGETGRGVDQYCRFKFQPHRNSDNVQISIDIPFADHPYLIGPRGKKCQYLMERLKTLVHFPDSNRRYDGPKLNTVLISGPMKSAEEMRRQLRGRTPIRLNVDLEHMPNPQLTIRRMEEAIVDRSLPIRMTYTDGYKSAMLKTEWRNEVSFVRFCNEFMGASSPLASSPREVYTMMLSLLPLMNPWNSELSQSLVTYINDVLECQLLYPPKEKFNDRAPYYFVRGSSVVRVLQAARFLFGLTMFQVTFNIPPRPIPISEQTLDEWRDSLLVHATVEPIYKMPSVSMTMDHHQMSCSPMLLGEKITLRSFEFCINNVYSIRSALFGYKNMMPTTVYEFMDGIVEAIPVDVFTACRLFYPLYSIADEDSIELDGSYSSKQFFNHFYGGPYSIRHDTSPDKNLSMLAMDILDISGGSDEVTMAKQDTQLYNPSAATGEEKKRASSA